MPITNEDIMSAVKEIQTGIEISNNQMFDVIEELKLMKTTCMNLEQKNTALQKEIIFLKKQLRKDNFLIHSIPKSDGEHVKDIVNNVFSEVNIVLPDYALNDCYRLGNGPIMVKLNNHNIKKELFRNRNILKGKNIAISHDRTPEEREDGKRIHSYLMKLKVLDKDTTFRKGLFKVKGAFYKLEEVDGLIKRMLEDTPSANEDELRTLKCLPAEVKGSVGQNKHEREKRKYEQNSPSTSGRHSGKLDSFFRTRSASDPSNSPPTKKL